MPSRRRAARRVILGVGLAVAVVTGVAFLTRSDSEGAEASSSAVPSPAIVVSPSSDPGSTGSLGRPFGSSHAAESALCGGTGALECLRLTVPADHENADGSDRLEVRFGLHAAEPDQRTGTLVIATGGPGSSGIELAPGYLQILPDSVLDRYDIVFFEQRGVRGSVPIDCRDADLDIPDWAQLAATDFHAAAEESAAWVEACLAEADVHAPSVLERFATGQAAADLDAYLDHIGAERVVLYGESYGTHLVQVYATRRPDRVDGLILDAAVDPTMDAVEASVQQASAFSEVLARLFEACDRNALCADDFTDTTVAATWDQLANRLKTGSIDVALPSRNGQTIEVPLSLDDLVLTSGSLLYESSGRALLLRTMASVARDDLRPLTRLASLTAGVDPETGRHLSSLTESYAGFYAIACQDYPVDGEAGVEGLGRGYRDLVEGGSRMAAVVLGPLPCVTGFGGDTAGAPIEPLVSADFPVLVLTSTADPATPTEWAEAIAERMPNAYLVVTTDGGHGTFGWGLPCPDDLVKAFLVFGDLPNERRTECDGRLVDPYVPLPLGGPAEYRDVLEALIGVEEALYWLPDYVLWDGSPRRLGCPHGGWLQLSWNGSDLFELHECQLMADWPLDGTIQVGLDFTTRMALDLPNGELTYESSADWEVTVEGTLDGAAIELRRTR
ncbi:MAG: alpha/beta hydrolase [Chloroflexota bacterium]